MEKSQIVSYNNFLIDRLFKYLSIHYEYNQDETVMNINRDFLRNIKSTDYTNKEKIKMQYSILDGLINILYTGKLKRKTFFEKLKYLFRKE